MPDYNQTNQATAAAAASISAGATSVILETGKGALFPSVFPFQVLLQQYNSSSVVTAQEIASCTNRSGDVLTITRAAEAVPNTPSSSTQAQVARSFDITLGIVQVTNVVTRSMLDEILNTVKKTGNQIVLGRKHLWDNDTFLGVGTQSYVSIGNAGTNQDIYIDGRSDVYASTNFRMRAKGTGVIEFFTNLVSRFFIDGDGRVGVGTNSLDSNTKMTVKSRGTATRIFRWLSSDDQTIGEMYEESDTRGSFSVFNASQVSTVRFDTNGNSYMNGGNVGVGTSTPAEKLDVSGGAKIGNSTGTNAGTMRWDGNNFQGYNGSSWVNMNFGGCKAFTTSFSSSLTLTTVPFASESFDTGGYHNTVTNNPRVTVPVGHGGVYMIVANGKVNGSVGYTQTGVQLFKNGTLMTVGGGGYDQWIPGFSMSEIENCVEGDYFELKIQTDINRTWDYVSLTLIKQ